MQRLQAGDSFPNFKLPDHSGKLRRLSAFTQQSEMDRRSGFENGYPVIVIFYRGFFCPRDQQQFRMLLDFQRELRVNYCSLVSISADEVGVTAAFRAGLNAKWTFFSDRERTVIKQVGVPDETEGEYPYRSLPFTFILNPDLSIYKVYNGWFYVGRPTLEELRQDLRMIMSKQDYYDYEAYNTVHVKQLRIPAQAWLEEQPPGANGLPVYEGVVSRFDLRGGSGYIDAEKLDTPIFFNFTAIPGTGYRTIRPGQEVLFELVETYTGYSARNVRKR